MSKLFVVPILRQYKPILGPRFIKTLSLITFVLQGPGPIRLASETRSQLTKCWYVKHESQKTIQMASNYAFSMYAKWSVRACDFEYKASICVAYHCKKGWNILCSPDEDLYIQPSHAQTNCNASASPGSLCYKSHCISTMAPTLTTDPPLER